MFKVRLSFLIIFVTHSEFQNLKSFARVKGTGLGLWSCCALVCCALVIMSLTSGFFTLRLREELSCQLTFRQERSNYAPLYCGRILLSSPTFCPTSADFCR